MENYKLIKQFATNTYALFNMREDPMEHNNVIDSAPNAVELIEIMDSVLQTNASMYSGLEAKKTTLDDKPPNGSKSSAIYASARDLVQCSRVLLAVSRSSLTLFFGSV